MRRLNPIDCWIPGDRYVKVAGYELPGLIYCGTNIDGEEPALIDTSLPVSSRPTDVGAPLLDYCTDYQTASPEARTAYLEWLATGRANQNAHIGLALLFFFGLERRVLVDGVLDGQLNFERALIRAEVERLRQVYVDDEVFFATSSRFLAYIEAEWGGEEVYARTPFLPKRTKESSLQLRVGLGHAAADRIPLSAEWALAWVIDDPGFGLTRRTSRQLAAFSERFIDEYPDKFGEGILLECSGARLTFAYRPVSRSLFRLTFASNACQLIESSNQPSARRRLERLIEKCDVRGPRPRIPKRKAGQTVVAPDGTTRSGDELAIQFDAARVCAIRQETAAVEKLLGGVFNHEESGTQVADGGGGHLGHPVGRVLGLDGDLAIFLRLLVTRKSWGRAELAKVAAGMQLMLDGALEHVNEAVLDAFDAPLTEGEDPIEINHEILEVLPV